MKQEEETEHRHSLGKYENAFSPMTTEGEEIGYIDVYEISI